VFDFDGVIADSERLHLRAYQEVLAPEGVTLSDEAYYERYLGYDDVGVFRTLGRDYGLDMSDERLRHFIERKGERYETLAASCAVLFPGAAELVREAAAAVPIAIASGALLPEIEEVLDRTGLRVHFPVIIGAEQTEHGKPHPDPYRLALARLSDVAGRDLEPWRTVAIEDSKWGLVSAREAGLRPVAVAHTYSEAELRPDAELVFARLADVTVEALDTLVAAPGATAL
jgi:beta-phosphoglucomutase